MEGAAGVLNTLTEFQTKYNTRSPYFPLSLMQSQTHTPEKIHCSVNNNQ